MKTNKNKKTEIILVIDNSGSMWSTKTDMKGGLKTFLEKQKGGEGICKITQYDFSSKVSRKFENVDVANVGEITILPSGGTALYDAVGTAINEVGARLAKEKKENRPDLVVVCVLTDGQENSSREFTQKQIKDLISHQESKYSWEFTFLGEGLDVQNQGMQTGFSFDKSMAYSKGGIGATTSILSDKINLMRSGAASKISYTAAERAEANI